MDWYSMLCHYLDDISDILSKSNGTEIHLVLPAYPVKSYKGKHRY